MIVLILFHPIKVNNYDLYSHLCPYSHCSLNFAADNTWYSCINLISCTKSESQKFESRNTSGLDLEHTYSNLSICINENAF